MADPIKELLNYQQADMDGIMVLVSRQAIHETADEIKRLRAANQEYGRWLREKKPSFNQLQADKAELVAKLQDACNRLDTIRETNPEISLDYDIGQIHVVLAKHKGEADD